MNNLDKWFQTIRNRFPNLTRENFNRLIMLYYGVNFNHKDSFPDPFTHYEIIYTAHTLSKDPVLTFWEPHSPFSFIETGIPGEKVLLYEGKYIDTVTNFEQKSFDNKKPEPFYFYVREIKDELVLKLNPIQLCDFFQNPSGMRPCSFCFRNDMVSRFRNISAVDLVKLVIHTEQKRDNLKTLKSIDELSIVTGSYTNNDEYIDEISTLVKGLRSLVSDSLRVVVGSHEGRGKTHYQKLKQAGVTVFAFPVESVDDAVRESQMNNRKGAVPIRAMLKYLKEAIHIFGEEGVIVRLVAGMGDKLTEDFTNTIKRISQMGTRKGPYFNINEYMPFTHYHWRLFRSKRPFTLDYLFHYQHIINTYVPKERQLRFKISP